MNGKLPTLRRAFSLLFLFGVLSRVVGVIREILIAQSFGVSPGLDAVYLGLAIPIALTSGIGTGLMRAAVPAGAGLGRESLAALLHVAIRRVVLVLIPATLLLCATAPLWGQSLAREGDGVPRDILVMGALFGSLALSAGGMTGVLAGIANARGNHLSLSLSPLVYNLCVCAAIVLLGKEMGVIALPIGILAGEFSQIVVHWTGIRDLLPLAAKPQIDRQWRQLVSGFWPAAAGASFLGLNLAIDRMFAATLEEGSIAALAYADKLVNLPVGLLGTALAIPLFTRLSRFQAQENRAAFNATLLLGLRLLFLGGLPVAALMFWIGGPLIGLLLERGAFGEEAVRLTTIAFQGYAAGIAFLCSSTLLISAGLTIRNPWVIVQTIIVSLVLNVVLDYVFVRAFGLMGIALATSIVAAVNVMMMLRIISPELLSSRALWIPTMRALVWAVTLFGVLGGLQAFLPYDYMMCYRISTVYGACLAAGATTLLLWPIVLGREWRSLTELRNEAAGWMQPREQ